MPKRSAYPVPVFPSVPQIKDAELRRWMLSMTAAIQNFTRDTIRVGTDYDLISNVTRQSLAAGFTITPDSHDIEIYSSSGVTSDTTTAIKDGRNGQTIVLTNTGSNTIKIKDNANTLISEDITLSTNDTLSLRWSETLSAWIQIATGNLWTINNGRISCVTTIGNIGGGDDDLQTWTIPANLLVDGSEIEIWAETNTAGNANAKTLKIWVGGSAITINTVTTNPNGITFITQGRIRFRSSTTVRYNLITHISGAGAAIETILNGNMTTTIDTTADMVIKFTGQGTNDNDITQRWVSFIFKKAAP